MGCIEQLFNKYDVRRLGLSGLTDELLCAYINNLSYNRRDLIIITNTLFEANKIYQSLTNYNNQSMMFPMDDFLTSEAIAISPDLKVTRLETLNSLVDRHEPLIVVTHLMGLLRYLPTKEMWQKSVVILKEKMEISKDELLRKLYNLGYTNETLVTKTGEIGNRGFIVDLFPIKENNPIRIEFWGDTVDSIRYFDPETQLSLKEIESIKIYPFDEFILDTSDDVPRKQKYLPLYTPKTNNIIEYLNNPIVIYKDYNQIKNANLALREEIFNYSLNDKSKIETNYMYDFNDLNYEEEIYSMSIDDTLPKVKLDRIDRYSSKEGLVYNGNFNKINEDLKNFIENKKTPIICLRDSHQIKNFISYLDDPYVITNENNIIKGKVNIIEKSINNGYNINEYIVIGETNLFKTTTNKGIYKSSFKYGSKIKDITKLNIGDYVVHTIHGIGIYGGIETLEKQGLRKDYLVIKYKDNDKLYIPVEKIDLIQKFSSNEGVMPKIHKLGGLEWQKTKLRVRDKIKDIADQLLRISAEREAKEGFMFSKDSEEQILFEEDFIYEETKDQLYVIKQIKDDMEKGKAMDRLLCGDVGYGKTEVAFRAAFKAVGDSKQVAFLCPTTILSNQHYENALERYKNFPVNIELLNRFTSPKKVREIIEGMQKGTVDMVIGTHRLLSKDVKFKDLGLLIIDEEQRFGVTHKEKIKEYKANVDVLTLSATPIPRTLQISMLGLRDLSLIETPPINRFPIQTYVLEQNNHVIKDAIYKELSRNGQIFLLYNRVENITSKVAEIKALVPEARITYAHGRMSKHEIEDTMLDFINHEYDVLICTTIIETGIDIPNVNTLIIIDADRFGLSQLYQIRGRVGRSNKIAYAYLMYDNKKVLSEIATKRLNVIKEFTELGSGFSIALKDLSIRGAGDILGSEQAGFIDSVGIDLYIKMLNDEVKRLKGITVQDEEERDDKPLLEVETHIDNSYVENDDLKIEIHRKINQIDSYDKLLEIKKEIEDRFGKISESMLIYMYEEWFEKIAPKAGVEKVNQTKNSIEITLSEDETNKIEIEKLFIEVNKISRMFRFSYQHRKLKIILDTIKLDNHWLYYIIELMQIMINRDKNRYI